MLAFFTAKLINDIHVYNRMITKRSIGFLAVTILAAIGIGFLSFDFISSSAQTSEPTSAEVIFVYSLGGDATQQDCIDIGGTVTFNYEIGQYECIRG